jgi:hypothetical protein
MVDAKGALVMTEESAWTNLGSSLGTGIRELIEKIEGMELQIQAIQRDFITSLEGLQRRLNRVEENKSVDSIFDVMTIDEVKEDLGVDIEIGITDTEPDSDSYVVSSGFTAPPPQQRGVDVDVEVLDLPVEIPLLGTIEDTEEIVTDTPPPTEEAQEEVVEEVLWATPENNLELAVGAIKEYIGNKGGVVNQYMKRFDLIPPDADSSFRKKVVGELEKAGYQTYKVNRIRHFYCDGEVDPVKQYEKVYGQN